MDWNSIVSYLDAHVAPLGKDVAIALVMFLIGRSLARLLARGLSRGMARGGVDLSLRKFLGDVAYAVMLMAVITASLDAVGVRPTAVIAVLGAAGLAIGLALQGSLSNFAAGAMLIANRQYKVGDLVLIGKHLGRVEVIKVFHTVLVTSDNREITIPNAKIVADPIENLTTRGTRRLDLMLGVPHGTDLAVLRPALAAVLAADTRVHASPAPTIDIADVTTTDVRLRLQPWTSCADHAAVASSTIEQLRVLLLARDVAFTLSVN